MSRMGYGFVEYPMGSVGLTTCLGFPKLVVDACHKLMVTPPSVCDRTIQVGATLCGISSGSGFVCRSCACNLMNAVCLRHLCERPPCLRKFSHAVEWLTRLEPIVRSASAEYSKLFDTWLARWPEAKRRQILHSVNWDVVCPDRVKCFVKREVSISFPSKARMIQSYANMSTQELFAREFLIFQKAFCCASSSLNDFKGVDIDIACGMNSVDLAAWMDDVAFGGRKVWFYERDFKRFDATVGDEAFDLKIRAYRNYSVGMADFAARSRSVIGTAKTKWGRLRFREWCGTKSGHCDTTIGNSIINAAVMLEAFVELGLEGGILIMGDDALAYSYTDFQSSAVAAIESQYGFLPEARKFADWRHVSFISGCWFEVASGRTAFVPKPGRLLNKLCLAIDPPKKKILSYVNAVAKGIEANCGFLPVVRVLLRRMRRDLPIDTTIAPKRYLNFVSVVGSTVDCVVMASFCRRYGFCEADVLHLESYLLALPPVCFFRHPFVDLIDEVDLADLPCRIVHGAP